MKRLIVFTLLSLAVIVMACSDEPQTKINSIKGARIVSQEEFNAKASDVNPPQCFIDHGVRYCCYMSGGVICVKD